MSLLTGNGQIEYRCPTDEDGSTVSRIGGMSARSCVAIPIILLVTNLYMYITEDSLERHAPAHPKFKCHGDPFISMLANQGGFFLGRTPGSRCRLGGLKGFVSVLSIFERVFSVFFGELLLVQFY